MNLIYAIHGDFGGSNEVIPVMKMMENSGIEVRHFTTGNDAKKVSRVLDQIQVPYETRRPNTSDKPSVIVVGTSATAVEGQIMWTRFGCEQGIPVIWIEDIWGTGENPKCFDVSPDVMCVVDDIAASIAKKIRRNLTIEVVGKPSFKALIKKYQNVDSIRTTTRLQLAERIGIDSFEGIIITYWSGGETPSRACEHLGALQEAFRRLNRNDILFVLRLHPKLQDDNKHHLRLLSQRMQTNVVTAHDINMNSVLAASDINVGEWGSTSMYISTILGTPAVMCMFPDDREQRLTMGYPDGKPPLLLAKAGYGPTSQDLLSKVIVEVISDPSKARDMVRTNGSVFQKLLESGADTRIAEVIKRYL